MDISWLILLAALRTVESNNGLTSANELQIREICVSDVNRIYGTYYTMDDVYSKEKSDDIARLYLEYWGKKASSRPSYETYARIWNGGPNGNKKRCTKKYWNKVKKELKR